LELNRAWVSNDNVYSTITNAAKRASVLLQYTAVPGTTTGETQATWDYVSGSTPVEPTYPNGGGLMLAGTLVAGPADGNARYKLSLRGYAGYSYEVYGNPTMAELGWSALPFSLSQTGAIDRSIHTATSEGALDIFVEAKAVKGFYYISFRVPGANAGTP
jgi:hypothetical protein